MVLAAAVAQDAPAIAALHAAVAEDLTARFGKGHWSSGGSEQAVLRALKTARVYVRRQRRRLIATLQLQTKKPWAIDVRYFTPCKKALYLTSMAVDPRLQGKGVGRSCLDEVETIGRLWPADAIRLDAYDAEAGAGDFYRKCGYVERGRVVYRNTPLVYFERML